MPKYSVIMPTTPDRAEKNIRAVTSIVNQTFGDWELIVVNTTDQPFNSSLASGKSIRVVEAGFNSERAIGRNLGMKNATGEWITWLDSDDEYVPFYFEQLNEIMDAKPGAQVINFASIVYHKNWTSTIRHAFQPGELGHKSFVGVEFKSGRISTGSFVFRRTLLGDVGYLPHATLPYGGFSSFSALANNPNYPKRDDGQHPPMGNPWGDDYQMFYQLTRKYDSVPVDVALYIQHVR